MPSQRLHDLGHTAATLIGSEGIPVVAVSEMLGHSSVAMTLDIYSHVFPDMHKDAAAALDRLLGDRAGKPDSEDHAI